MLSLEDIPRKCTGDKYCGCGRCHIIAQEEKEREQHRKQKLAEMLAKLTPEEQKNLKVIVDTLLKEKSFDAGTITVREIWMNLP